MQNKKLQVSAIKNGTVIDHIPAERLFTVLNILKLNHIETLVTFGTNLESKRLGKKGIIKVENIYFKEKDINKIALIAPQAKLNVIKDYEVVEKWEVKIPDEINGIVKCVNPMCITNHEKITTKFAVVSKDSLALKCHYCEKITDNKHIEVL